VDPLTILILLTLLGLGVWLLIRGLVASGRHVRDLSGVEHGATSVASESCGNCGHQNFVGNTFCGRCGTQLEDDGFEAGAGSLRTCNSCSTEALPGDSYCRQCGDKFSGMGNYSVAEIPIAPPKSALAKMGMTWWLPVIFVFVGLLITAVNEGDRASFGSFLLNTFFSLSGWGLIIGLAVLGVSSYRGSRTGIHYAKGLLWWALTGAVAGVVVFIVMLASA